ncbi:glycoside hydrolase family 6 protein [Streptomyces sp. M19]
MIADRPQGIWFSRYEPSTVTEDVAEVTSAAAAAGQTPVLVPYALPNRDCGGASAGGRRPSPRTTPGSTTSRPGSATRPP